METEIGGLVKIGNLIIDVRRIYRIYLSNTNEPTVYIQTTKMEPEYFDTGLKSIDEAWAAISSQYQKELERQR
jgi:hypothetical protein